MELLTALANWTPVVSLIHSAIGEAAGGPAQSMGGWAYDIVAFLSGMTALGHAGQWLATQTETTADDAFWAAFLKWTAWALAQVTLLTSKVTVPSTVKPPTR